MSFKRSSCLLIAVPSSVINVFIIIVINILLLLFVLSSVKSSRPTQNTHTQSGWPQSVGHVSQQRTPCTGLAMNFVAEDKLFQLTTIEI